MEIAYQFLWFSRLTHHPVAISIAAMKNFALTFLVLFSSLAPLRSDAFLIPEHLAITDRAIFGLQKCGMLPGAWDMNWKEIIAAADKDEDTNIVRKFKYAHYYNPNHALNLAPRVDSSVSVLESTQQIDELLPSQNKLEVYKLVGRIVHHLQDAAVPAHAVPVNHLGNDGFEKSNASEFFAEPISIEECAAIALAEPMDILREAALQTLNALEAPVLYADKEGIKRSSWSIVFWQVGEGDGFGRYGILGDNFGKAEIRLKDGSSYTVDPVQYTLFKRAQLSLAILATQRAILWANRKLGL